MDGLTLNVILCCLLVPSAWALRCYQCDNFNYNRCAVQICQGGRCQNRTSMNGMVSRMCGTMMGPDGCRVTFGETLCTCDKDLCNGDGSQQQSATTCQRTNLATVFLILFIIYFIRTVVDQK